MFASFQKKFPKIGTAKIMDKAMELGFSYDNPEWVNFGQGSPELGEIEGDLNRVQEISCKDTMSYAPANGTKTLRQKIVDFYNQILNQKQFQSSQVSVAAGGRNALTRIFASLKPGLKMGYLNPDYAGYKGLFLLFPDLKYISINLSEKEGFKLDLGLIKKYILEFSLEAILLSNPSNPSGQKLSKPDLKNLINFCKKHNCLLIHDEFYSRYTYDEKGPYSALEFVENLDQTPLLVIDGLSKGLRYPGFRLSWVIGGSNLINKINFTGSVLDGGASHPIQQLSINLLDAENFETNLHSLRKTFKQKKCLLQKALQDLGLKIPNAPQAAFYLFADISFLKKGFNIDTDFCENLLTAKVTAVPGRSFDLSLDNQNPKFTNLVRFSYGLKKSKIEQGIKQIQNLLN